MDASDLSEFNSDKAATQLALWPATVMFQKTGSAAPYSCTFGETANDGALRDDGQAVQEHRIGWLFFPVLTTFAPALLQTFKVTASTQAAYLGKSYQIDEIISGPGEPVLKCRCHRIN